MLGELIEILAVFFYYGQAQVFLSGEVVVDGGVFDIELQGDLFIIKRMIAYLLDIIPR